MADITYINRAFIPPTETEVVDGTQHAIIWSLGTEEHPWKNVYICDYEQEPEKIIDVYSLIKNIASLPTEERSPGMIMRVKSDGSGNLEWSTIDDALLLYASSTAIVNIIGGNSVQRATSDEDGLNFKTGYLKKSGFNAESIATTLDTKPVQRATGDEDGNSIKNSYVNRDYVDSNYVKRESSSKSSSLHDQGLADVAWTGDWVDLTHKPTIPDETWTIEEINSRIASHVENRHTSLEYQVVTNTSNIALLDTNKISNTDYATNVVGGSNKAGIIRVNNTNGLKIVDSYGTLETTPATYDTRGTIYIPRNKGLNLEDSTGELTASIATTYTGTETPEIGSIYVDTRNGLSLDEDGRLDTVIASSYTGSETSIHRGTLYVDTRHGLYLDSNGKLDTTIASGYDGTAANSKRGTLYVDVRHGLALDADGKLDINPASTSNRGSVYIDISTGLNIDGNGKLGISYPTRFNDSGITEKAGVIKVKGGNGLTYNYNSSSSDYGCISMNLATTTAAGAVKLGEVIYNSSYISAAISAIPEDGKFYHWNGSITYTKGSSTVTYPSSGKAWFIVQKYDLRDVHGGSYVSCEAKPVTNAALHFSSMDNGSTWYCYSADN